MSSVRCYIMDLRYQFMLYQINLIDFIKTRNDSDDYNVNIMITQ